LPTRRSAAESYIAAEMKSPGGRADAGAFHVRAVGPAGKTRYPASAQTRPLRIGLEPRPLKAGMAVTVRA
jgi:hypothetical protein